MITGGTPPDSLLEEFPELTKQTGIHHEVRHNTTQHIGTTPHTTSAQHHTPHPHNSTHHIHTIPHTTSDNTTSAQHPAHLQSVAHAALPRTAWPWPRLSLMPCCGKVQPDVLGANGRPPSISYSRTAVGGLLETTEP